MSKIIIHGVVQRKPGYLYYLDHLGNLWETKMSHGRTKAKGEEIKERNRLKYKRKEEKENF
jgi:20S proteasome alpha/beta subunit